MINKDLVLGIDTSNYTTSLALMDTEGRLLANIKRPLSVKAGECGLRQSDAVFLHVKNIPEVMREAENIIKDGRIVCVGVSEKPRNIDGSYMPCFLSGVAVAESVALTHNVPLYKFSHQCGHIMSALFSSERFDLLSESSFCAFHVSGGTTEMLKVTPTKNAFLAEIVGRTADLNAGQLVDRVGVYMDVDFPAGAAMEKLALSYLGKVPSRKPSLKDFKINLSGIENIAKKLYDDTGDKGLVSRFVFEHIARALLMLSEDYESKYGKAQFVFAGGVMSNSIIKSIISKRLDASFAEPMLSADNAVGIAALALRSYKQ